MENLKKQKGITLVALIITIVVLLILAMVAIGAVSDSNIIGHSQNAAGSYNQAKANELDALTGYEETINKYVPNHEDGNDVLIELNQLYKGKKILEILEFTYNDENIRDNFFVVDQVKLKMVDDQSFKIKDNLTESDFVANTEVELGGVLTTYNNEAYTITIVYGANKEYDYTNFKFVSNYSQDLYGINPVILRVEKGHKIIGNGFVK